MRLLLNTDNIKDLHNYDRTMGYVIKYANCDIIDSISISKGRNKKKKERYPCAACHNPCKKRFVIKHGLAATILCCKCYHPIRKLLKMHTPEDVRHSRLVKWKIKQTLNKNGIKKIDVGGYISTLLKI